MVAGDLRPVDHHRLQAGRGPRRQPGPQGLTQPGDLLRTKAPGARGLRRLRLSGGKRLSDGETRPGRRGRLAALVEAVDAGEGVLPAAARFVGEDPEEAEAEGDRSEEEAHKTLERFSRRQTAARYPEPDAEEAHSRSLPRQRPEGDQIEGAKCDPGGAADGQGKARDAVAAAVEEGADQGNNGGQAGEDEVDEQQS